jgi:hypothetical protein
MPCFECNNGKYKYGMRGRCQFTTLEQCQAAERAVHARENKKDENTNSSTKQRSNKRNCKV